VNKTIIATAIVTAFSFGIAEQAQAKDPYVTITALAGNKTLSVKIRGNKKLGIKPRIFSEKIDIVHRGYTEIEMFSSDGATSIETEFGSDSYSWEDADGLRYVIAHYPENNPGPSVSGTVFAGKRRVGKFSLTDTKHGVHKATGRWQGVLAYPGGSELALGLQISSTPQAMGGGCVSYDARVNFPGHPYEQTAFYKCKGDENFYGAGFFFVDSVTSERWFVSLNVTVENGVFQGQAFTFSISGNGGSSWGKMYTERPQAFSL
jgi:hypothetical protein